MKMQGFLCVLVFWVYQYGFTQSIRKNYQEMTSYERNELVDAFYAMRSGPDLVTDLANFHGDNFNFDGTSDPTRLDIHFNLPDEPERQIFFPWHRRQMFEMEQAMQAINPDISMPWWDSSEDQSISSPLWDQDFMGQFNTAWNLGRNFATVNNVSLLPTPQDVIALQATEDFLIYSDDMERGRVHTGAHRWTGGYMPTPYSPNDPIFYLHHTFVDKLWDDWETAHAGGSSHIITSMLRYDGTYRFNGQLLPLVDPDDIVDSRTLGVFYAENQLAELTRYTVSNTYHNLENFYYQYVINVGDNFIVPAGTNCNVKSVTEINLLPGFLAESGSLFMASIDSQTATSRRDNNALLASRINNPNPFKVAAKDLDQNAYNPSEVSMGANKISVFPNPFQDKFNVILSGGNLEGKVTYRAEIFDAGGKKVFDNYFETASGKFEINHLINLESGLYIMELSKSEREIYRIKILKQ